jgi:hypothetical protein
MFKKRKRKTGGTKYTHERAICMEKRFKCKATNIHVVNKSSAVYEMGSFITGFTRTRSYVIQVIITHISNVFRNSLYLFGAASSRSLGATTVNNIIRSVTSKWQRS